jgi:pimeloyl-ACP methyl ester carboxylesterase
MGQLKRLCAISAALVCLLYVTIVSAQDIGGSYVPKYDPKKKSVLIFVHGVLGDARGTWTHQNGAYWPDLVSSDPLFAEANVYVHRYESTKVESAQDIEELATRLGDYLDRDRVIQRHEKIFFVAHSMGGLVTRAFLVQRRLPAKQVPMIYFFGTPTLGASSAGLASAASKNRQFENMKSFSRGTYAEKLAAQWLATATDPLTQYPRKIWSFCAYEKKPMYGQIIVEEDSATHLCNIQPRAVSENHIDMVKPNSVRAESHVYLSHAYSFTTDPKTQTVLAALDSSVKLEVIPDGHWHIISGFKNTKLRTDFVRVAGTQVGCSEQLIGTRLVRPTLGKGEVIVGTFTDVSRVSDLKEYVTYAVPRQGETEVNFKFVGSTSKDCTKGRADILVKYLIAEPGQREVP